LFLFFLSLIAALAQQVQQQGTVIAARVVGHGLGQWLAIPLLVHVLDGAKVNLTPRHDDPDQAFQKEKKKEKWERINLAEYRMRISCL
jgi:hypothetical protein